MGQDEMVSPEVARVGPRGAVQAADSGTGRQTATSQHHHGGVQQAENGATGSHCVAFSTRTSAVPPAIKGSTDRGRQAVPRRSTAGEHGGQVEAATATPTTAETETTQKTGDGKEQGRSTGANKRGRREHTGQTAPEPPGGQSGGRTEAAVSERTAGQTERAHHATIAQAQEQPEDKR